LALGIGALVTALLSTRVRWRAIAPAMVVVVAILNLPALFDGGLVDPALERDQSPPAAWLQASSALSATASEYRVMQLPGSEFGAFRWGYTVDPPLPGLTTKPLITRDLLPLGSPGVMDLLYALDDRVQQGILEPTSVAPVARYLGVDTLWVPNDIAFDRFRTPHPVTIADILTRQPSGLGAPTSYGTPTVNSPTIPMLDEHALTDGADTAALPPVQLVPVNDPQPIVRASTDVVEVAGSGDGVVDASAAGLLHGDEAVRYAADTATNRTGGAPSRVILTDSNRDRAHHWRSSQDVTGFTERGTATSDVIHPDEADQRLPVFGLTPNPADQTIANLEGGLVVSASGYGEPFAYRPEQRPAMAVDGDPTTAWVVGDRSNPVGEFITVSKASGELSLLQAEHTNAASIASRMITRVQLRSGDGRTADIALGPSSLVGTGQRVQVPGSGSLTITILAVGARPGGTDTGPSAVGFAELGVGRHTEIVRTPRLPSDLSSSTPLDIVLTRLRVDPMNRWRSDPERSLVRQFTTSDARSFEATITLQGDHRASDAVLARIDHTEGAMASARLTGDVSSRGIYATDGDPKTAWTSPFGPATGITLTVPLDGTPLASLRLLQRVDPFHSVISRLRVDVDGTKVDLAVGAADTSGVSTLVLPSPLVGHRMVLTILATKPGTTIDRRFAEVTQLPVSLREVSAPAIVRSTRLQGDLAPFCSKGLVTIDGTDVGLAMTQADVAALADGGTVQLHPCDGIKLQLAAGTHHLVSVDGLDSGIDVNRVTLMSGAGARPSPQPTVAVTRTLTTRTAKVSACPQGCWLIFGEGLNTAWTATTSGRSLGAPQQVAGGFNGWWLPPSTASTEVHISWTAQRSVNWALAASAVAVLLCLVLVFRPRRSVVAAAEWVSSPPSFSGGTWQPQSLLISMLAATGLIAVTALIAAPSTAVYALIPAVAIVVFRRPRVGAVAAALLMAVLGARILQRQLVNRFPANAAWPGVFEKLHRPGMLVVALLVVAGLAEPRDRDQV
jgi:arabinofuranan 3-O-arabinosyltransferase